MFNSNRIVSSLLMILLIVACSERLPVAPEFPGESKMDFELQKSYTPITVMTRNIYVGANLDVLLGAGSPEEIPILAAEAFQNMLATNFQERATALAKEVYETRPHLIGLQEVSLIRTQFPSDTIAGGTILAEDVFWDYLEIYINALADYGLKYKVVG